MTYFKNNFSKQNVVFIKYPYWLKATIKHNKELMCE